MLEVHICIFNMNGFPVNEFSMVEGIAEKINTVALQPFFRKDENLLGGKHTSLWVG